MYNSYHEHELCEKKENKDLYVCQEWVEEYIKYEDFLEIMTNENEQDNNYINFFDNNYKLFIGGTIIVLILVIVFVILRKKKGTLD